MNRSRTKKYASLYVVEIAPEEDISGWLSQHAMYRMQHRCHPQSPINLGSEDSPRYIHWMRATNLKDLVAKFDGALPEVDSLIMNNTRFPLFKAFLSPESARKMYQYHLADSRVGSYAGRNTGANTLAHMKFCSECYEHDMSELGYATWRRLHLARGILMCAEHGVPLLGYCDCSLSRTNMSTAQWKLDMKCLCGKRPKQFMSLQGNARRSTTATAHLAGLVLKGLGPGELSYESVVQAVVHQCRRLGISIENRASFLYEALRRSVGLDVMQHLAFRKTTIKCLTGTKFPYPSRHPIQALTAVHAVFEDFSLFSEVLQEAQEEMAKPMTVGRQALVALPSQESPSRIEEWREWVLAAKRKNPNIKRSDFPYTPMFCRHVEMRTLDSAWLDQVLPMRTGKNSAANRRPNHLQEQHILNLQIYMLTRYKAAIERRPFKRISKKQLVKGGPGSRWPEVIASPKIVALLEELTDTDRKLAMRCAEHFLPLVHAHSPSSIYGTSRWWTSQKGADLTTRIANVKIWLRKKNRQG